MIILCSSIKEYFNPQSIIYNNEIIPTFQPLEDVDNFLYDTDSGEVIADFKIGGAENLYKVERPAILRYKFSIAPHLFNFTVKSEGDYYLVGNIYTSRRIPAGKYGKFWLRRLDYYYQKFAIWAYKSATINEVADFINSVISNTTFITNFYVPKPKKDFKFEILESLAGSRVRYVSVRNIPKSYLPKAFSYFLKPHMQLRIVEINVRWKYIIYKIQSGKKDLPIKTSYGSKMEYKFKYKSDNSKIKQFAKYLLDNLNPEER